MPTPDQPETITIRGGRRDDAALHGLWLQLDVGWYWLNMTGSGTTTATLDTDFSTRPIDVAVAGVDVPNYVHRLIDAYLTGRPLNFCGAAVPAEVQQRLEAGTRAVPLTAELEAYPVGLRPDQEIRARAVVPLLIPIQPESPDPGDEWAAARAAAVIANVLAGFIRDGTIPAAGESPAWVRDGIALVPNRDGTKAAPSQGQDITDEQMNAILEHADNDADRLQSAYRVGFAAALGYEITVTDDGVQIGDRLTHRTPTP